jgi:hypothetical protein
MRPRQPPLSHGGPMSAPGSNNGPEMTEMRRPGADDRVLRLTGIRGISRRRDLGVRDIGPKLGIWNMGVADKVWCAPEQRQRPATSRSIVLGLDCLGTVLGPCRHGSIGSKTGHGLWMTCNIAYAAVATRSRRPPPGPQACSGSCSGSCSGACSGTWLAPIPGDEARPAKRGQCRALKARSLKTRSLEARREGGNDASKQHRRHPGRRFD